MDAEAILVSFIITAGQLADAYLRYLAFRDGIGPRDRRWLWGLLLGWGLLGSVLIYCWLFRSMGITASAYKIALMLGWVPYLAIFMTVVRRQISQHIFVFGMSALWSFIQHNWSSMAVALFLPDRSVDLVLAVHGALYLLWFLLAWPLECRAFANLLPPRGLLGRLPIGNYIAFLPLAIISGHLLLMADAKLWHTWPERLSRMYLPLVFFFFYRYMLIAAKNLYAQQGTERNHQLLQRQLSSLGEYRRLIQKNSEQVAVLRHDLRHNYRLIHAMLESGELAKARETIAAQLEKLEGTPIASYSGSPAINTVLAIYTSRAEEMGCKVKAQIDLPDNRRPLENDLALLLANVLENAINASMKQAEGQRELFLTLRLAQGRGTLELVNRHAAPFELTADGLPAEDTSIDHDGLGLALLTAFTRKYGADLTFWQKDGWVRLSLGWEDKGA